MKKYLYNLCVTVVLILLCAGESLAATTAAQALETSAARLNAAPSVTFKLTMTSGGVTTHPTLTISKNKYRLSSPELEVWFNGKTMWVYSPETREVNITEPTPEELVECNPVSLLNNYTSIYTARFPSHGQNLVELVSRNKTSALRKAVIEINPKTKMPVRIDATMTGQKTVNIKIDSSTEGRTLPESTFVYDAKAYPASEIIDLR